MPETNPCSNDGCNEKQCGDACGDGDIDGVCNQDGDCVFPADSVTCGNQLSEKPNKFNKIIFLLYHTFN